MKDVNMLINNGVNIEKSLELFGDMATYDETLEDFLNDVTKKLADIKRYKEMGDMANYAIYVHSLKSDAKYFGFEKLAELSYQHELESKANNIYFVNDNYNTLIIEANRIINLVRAYLGKEQTLQVAPAIYAEIKSKDHAILVVDDSNIINKFVQNIFNETFDVIIATDGEQAINSIKDDISVKIIGMLLDLNMPNVNGFAVLEYLRQNNLFSRIPVSIITGDNSKESVEKAFQYPIVDVIEKPFNEFNIKKTVEKMINMHTNH